MEVSDDISFDFNHSRDKQHLTLLKTSHLKEKKCHSFQKEYERHFKNRGEKQKDFSTKAKWRLIKAIPVLQRTLTSSKWFPHWTNPCITNWALKQHLLLFAVSKVQVQLELKICLAQCIFHLQKEKSKSVSRHLQPWRQRWVGLSDQSKGNNMGHRQHPPTVQKGAEMAASAGTCWKQEGTRAVRGVLRSQVSCHVKTITPDKSNQGVWSTVVVGCLLFARWESVEYSWSCAPLPSEYSFESSAEWEQRPAFLDWEIATYLWLMQGSKFVAYNNQKWLR